MIEQALEIDILKNLTIDMHQGINTVTENVEYLEKGIPILQSKHITKGFLNLDDTKYLSEKDYLKYKDKYQANIDDVLVCNIGTIGKSLRIDKSEKFLIAWNLFLIKLDNTKLYSQYFAHYLNHLSDQNYFDKFLTGGTVKFINKKTMGNIPVPIPPLPQQQKIANILDAADALRQNDKALLAKYDELTQALFLDMFGDPVSNEKGWEKVELGNVAKKITDGEHQNPPVLEFGKNLIMAKDVLDDKVDFTVERFVSEENYIKYTKKCNPEINDIVLVSRGATVGRCTTVKTEIPFCLMGSVILIKKGESFNSDYLCKLLINEKFSKQLVNVSSASAQQAIYISHLKKLKILLPPITLQNQFAERVALIEEQKAIAQTSLIKSEELFNSLLQKAFKGEL